MQTPSIEPTHTAAESDHSGHIAPTWFYIAVWGALMILTVITVAASRIDLGVLNLPIALGIATIKATLVALFFMHLFFDDKFNLVVLISGFIFVAIFCVLTVVDMLSRGDIYQRERHDIVPPARVEPAPAPPNATPTHH